MARLLNRVAQYVQKEPLTIAALCISACALFLTIFEVRATNYQNRISILPHLQFVTEGDPSSSTLDLSIQNQGLGPARVSGLEMYLGEEFTRFEHGLDWSLIIPGLAQMGVPADEIHGTWLPLRGLVAPGEKLTLLKMTVHDAAGASALARRLSSLDLGVCYCSLYGDCFHVATETRSVSDSRSCRFDRTTKVFRWRFRFHWPWVPQIDSDATHGY